MGKFILPRGQQMVQGFPIGRLKRVEDAVANAGGPSVSSVSNSDGSLAFSPTTGSVIGSINAAHENTFTVGQVFNDPDVTKTPLPPSTLDVTFSSDPSGFLAIGNIYDYKVYSYYYDGTSYAYDPTGIETSRSDPNDLSNYYVSASWDAGTDANGYLLVDVSTGDWMDMGSALSATITPSTTWNPSASFPFLTPNSLVVPGHPMWANKSQDWGTTDFNAMAMGLSGSNHLQFRWKYAGGSGSGALRFESDDGVIRSINANVYAETIYATSSISGYLYPTSMGQYYIGYQSSGGFLTGGSNFLFNPSTTRMLVSNSGITPQSQLHMHYSTATAVNAQFTNSSTGTTSSDGTLVGITTGGTFEIKQQENLPINIYTLGTLRATFDASASPRFTVYGGMQAQYNAIANTSSDGLLSSNLTSATSGVAIQRAGRLRFSSQGWDTGASATRTDDWVVEPVLTSGNPVTSVLSFQRQYNSGGYASLMTLGSDGFLKLIPSASGGAGTNRTLDFGNGYGNPAIYLYNAGSSTRYGWGMQAGAMQFFAASASGNLFTWNKGGDMQATGTNELMRLHQYASGTGSLAIPGAGGAFSPASPYKLELDGESLAGGTAGVEDIIRFRRGQTGGVSYPEAFSIGLGRYSSSGTGPDTRVDFKLKSIAATDFTADATVLTLQSNLLAIFYGDVQMADGKNLVIQSSTGTKIGSASTQKIGFWGATPIVQPTTSVGSATLSSPGAGTNIKSDDTFDGYTIQQVVKALRNEGLLA